MKKIASILALGIISAIIATAVLMNTKDKFYTIDYVRDQMATITDLYSLHEVFGEPRYIFRGIGRTRTYTFSASDEDSVVDDFAGFDVMISESNTITGWNPIYLSELINEFVETNANHH